MAIDLDEFIRTHAPAFVVRDAPRLLEALRRQGSVVRVIFDLGREYGRQEAADMSKVAELKRVLVNAEPRDGDSIDVAFRRLADAHLAIMAAALDELEVLRGCEVHADCLADRRLAIACWRDRQRTEAAAALDRSSAAEEP